MACYDWLQLVPISVCTKSWVADCMKSTECWWLVTDSVGNRGNDVIHWRALWWSDWRLHWLSFSWETAGRKRDVVRRRMKVVRLMWNKNIMKYHIIDYSENGFMGISAHSHTNQCAWSISLCQTVLVQAGWGSVLNQKSCHSACGVRPYYKFLSLANSRRSSCSGCFIADSDYLGLLTS